MFTVSSFQNNEMVTRQLAQRILNRMPKGDLKEKSVTPFVRDVYKAFMTVIKDDLRTQGQFNIKGVGRLFVRTTRPRQIFNVNTRKVDDCPAHKVVAFRPSKILREAFRDYIPFSRPGAAAAVTTSSTVTPPPSTAEQKMGEQ
eukprot:EC720144.1.p1 GENE.EC720144.1~~EC720144.1.p1  ORF type:complete len:143 (+),score=13.10 EC720144.1:3-431(+)